MEPMGEKRTWKRAGGGGKPRGVVLRGPQGRGAAGLEQSPQADPYTEGLGRQRSLGVAAGEAVNMGSGAQHPSIPWATEGH